DDKDVAQKETWNDEISGVRQHRVAWRLSPAGQSLQIQGLELSLEISEVVRLTLDSIECTLPNFLHERTGAASRIFRIVIDKSSGLLQHALDCCATCRLVLQIQRAIDDCFDIRQRTCLDFAARNRVQTAVPT